MLADGTSNLSGLHFLMNLGHFLTTSFLVLLEEHELQQGTHLVLCSFWPGAATTYTAPPTSLSPFFLHSEVDTRATAVQSATGTCCLLIPTAPRLPRLGT